MNISLTNSTSSIIIPIQTTTPTMPMVVTSDAVSSLTTANSIPTQPSKTTEIGRISNSISSSSFTLIKTVKKWE